MATIASSNFTTLAYTEETTYGEMPATTDLRYTNFTGESLQYSKESISSNNINPSRQVSDLIQTGFQVSGGINIELGSKTFDEFIEGAMWSDWGTATDVDIIADFNNTTKTITASTGTPFLNIVAKQFIKISNTAAGTAASAANLGIFMVESKTSSTVLVINSNYTLATEATKNVTVVACQIANPTSGLDSVKHSYYFEKAMEDLDPIYYMSYSGCMVNSWTVSAQSSSILTGSFDFMGQTSTIYDDGVGVAGSASQSDSTKLAVANSEIMNSVSHVGSIRMDSVDKNVAVASGTGVYFQALDFTLSNNLRGVQAIGQMGNVSVSPGQLSVTGNLNAYFQDDTMYAYFVSGNEFSLSYEVTDANGDSYVFYFPRVQVSTSTMSAGGNDQDLVENMTWQALMDSTLKSTVIVHRLYSDYTDAPDLV